MRTLPTLLASAVLLSCSAAPDTAETSAGGVPAAAASPASAEVEALLREGRELLARERAAEAQLVFERAAELDGGSLATQLWLLRSWMDQGRSNDTLDAIDALAREGAEGPEIDYLYGMAFTRRAQDKIALGTTDASVQMNFEDAVGLLESAVAGAPERFADAWPALAHSAWMSLDLERARAAAEHAIAAFPEGTRERALLGRIAFSQFREAYDAAGGWTPEVEAIWQTAHDAFARAIELSGAADREGEEYVLCDLEVQRANALLWKEESAAAGEAYAAAAGWAPDAVDYAQARTLFDAETFRGVLEAGLERSRERHGADSPRDVALLWWLGWARWAAGAAPAAEEALLAALDKAPETTSAWFYVAMARYDQEDWVGTVEALRQAWQEDPVAVVAEMQADPELHSAKLAYVVGWCAGEGRLADAALLARINAESLPDEPTHWSDLGLFLRDQGEGLEDRARAAELYEEAYAAYARALELAPDDPQILNDAAVMLHYYLERDLDRAEALYARAQELARERLEAGAVPEELLPVVETALRDATDNLAKLQAARGEKAGS